MSMTALTDSHPLTGHPVEGSADQSVAGALQVSLTDALRAVLLAKHAHWNVTGPRFRGIHLQLDELADVARDAADAIAERLAALGASPDGRPESLAGAALGLGPGPLRDTDLIEDLLVVLTAMTDRCAVAIDGALAADPLSQAIVIDVAADLAKQAWMLRAQR